MQLKEEMGWPADPRTVTVSSLRPNLSAHAGLAKRRQRAWKNRGEALYPRATCSSNGIGDENKGWRDGEELGMPG